MKKFTVCVLLAAFLLTALSGCGLFRFVARLDAAEEVVERAEDAAKAAAKDAIVGGAAASALPEAALTAEDAQNIALEHAGFTRDEVERLRAEGEIDDGVPHYDVQFAVGLVEYEYEIHAETGDILSFEQDD